MLLILLVVEPSLLRPTSSPSLSCNRILTFDYSPFLVNDLPFVIVIPSCYSQRNLYTEVTIRVSLFPTTLKLYKLTSPTQQQFSVPATASVTTRASVPARASVPVRTEISHDEPSWSNNVRCYSGEPDGEPGGVFRPTSPRRKTKTILNSSHHQHFIFILIHHHQTSQICKPTRTVLNKYTLPNLFAHCLPTHPNYRAHCALCCKSGAERRYDCNTGTRSQVRIPLFRPQWRTQRQLWNTKIFNPTLIFLLGKKINKIGEDT